MAVALLHETRRRRRRPFSARPRIPFAPYGFRAVALAKEVDAGAEFIQTQYCSKLPRLRRFMSQVHSMRLHEESYILIGVSPQQSAKRGNRCGAESPARLVAHEAIQRPRGVAANRRAEGWFFHQPANSIAERQPGAFITRELLEDLLSIEPKPTRCFPRLTRCTPLHRRGGPSIEDLCS